MKSFGFYSCTTRYPLPSIISKGSDELRHWFIDYMLSYFSTITNNNFEIKYNNVTHTIAIYNMLCFYGFDSRIYNNKFSKTVCVSISVGF